MRAAIHYETDAFQVAHEKPMGRHFAGLGFLSAHARFSRDRQAIGFVRNPTLGEEFVSVVRDLSPDCTSRYITLRRAGELKEVGCLFTPSAITASQAWQRTMHGERAWSLCGINHTLSSATIMDAVTDMLTAPLHPWDAIICTSQASRSVILALLERQAQFLSRRLGATRFPVPQLPVIPLGVDCKAQQDRMTHRDRARAGLGLEPAEIVVLFVGRLSFHAKANPAPMYTALESLAARHRVTLVECGWTPNDPIADALAEARAKLCPSVRSIVLDGREPEARNSAWAAADIFCSLSDNIQETFGLTPIEAMAAGLPVVVTDWDGYRDTVRDGIDGFTVPTVMAPPGMGQRLADRHALGLDTYDMYIGQAANAVAVDADAVADALERLASDPDLRRTMGANGAARAREVFDWRVIVGHYERLWDELAALRLAESETQPPKLDRNPWPARPDPFDLFRSFPTSVLSTKHLIRRTPGIGLQDVEARLALTVTMMNGASDLTAPISAGLWEQLPADWSPVSVMRVGNKGILPLVCRALIALAKYGLVQIRPPQP